MMLRGVLFRIFRPEGLSLFLSMHIANGSLLTFAGGDSRLRLTMTLVVVVSVEVSHSALSWPVIVEITFLVDLCNPLKPSVIIRSHFECSAPERPNLPYLISDTRALWRSGLSAIVPECQKLETAG